MTDISDLASLNFEDLAQADLFDLVTSSNGGEASPPSIRRSCSTDSRDYLGRSSSTDSRGYLGTRCRSYLDDQESYSHITLINGEQIWMREDAGSGEQESADPMDLNSILQAGVVERVDPASPGVSSTTNIDLSDLECDMEDSLVSCPPLPPPVIIKASPPPRPRTTILASQLPLPIPTSTKDIKLGVRLDASGDSALIISSSDISTDSANNNNSLLRSALTGKTSFLIAPKGSDTILRQSELNSSLKKALMATVIKQEQKEKPNVDDILMLSLENKEALAKMKAEVGNKGTTTIASELFPNTKVTTEAAKDAPNVISIEVDGSGNLVLHNAPPELALGPSHAIASSAARRAISHLAKARKYHRRPKDEPKKESRLLHYCHICNKGFKDKYSVNVHVRTHTGEKPFSCHLCGKCFRQKAHLAKHHQTHAAKQGLMDSVSGPLSSPVLINNDDNNNL